MSNGLKMTVLYREGGKWDKAEVGCLFSGLRTVVSELQVRPEYLVLIGHYTEEKIAEQLSSIEGLGKGQSFEVTHVTDLDSKELPFRPSI